MTSNQLRIKGREIEDALKRWIDITDFYGWKDDPDYKFVYNDVSGHITVKGFFEGESLGEDLEYITDLLHYWTTKNNNLCVGLSEGNVFLINEQEMDSFIEALDYKYNEILRKKYPGKFPDRVISSDPIKLESRRRR